MFYRDERLALFIYGANLHYAMQNLSWQIDFKKLYEMLAGSSKLVRAAYYTALFDSDEFSSSRPLVDWLQYNGYIVISKPIKAYTDSQTGVVTHKGNLDIEIAVDAMELASRIDHIILITGDGDFTALIASLQRQGVRVTVLFPQHTKPSHLSDDLRRQADSFVDLDTWREKIGRVPSATTT